MVSTFSIHVAGHSDIGHRRAHNEDAWWAGPLGEGSWLLVVCDGLGGSNAGEVASATAVEALREALAGAGKPSAARLREAIFVANVAVKKRAMASPDARDMGTTLTAAWISEESAVWGQVGDSRLFRLRGRQTVPLTPEHSMVGRMRRSGALSEAEARIHPRRAVIDQCLGEMLGEFLPETEAFDFRPGDALLLCSDGLTDGLAEAELAGYVDSVASSDASTVARALVDASVAASGRDNTTAIVAWWAQT